MKDIVTVVLGLLFMSLVWAGWTSFQSWKQESGVLIPPNGGGVACTTEAKICPDGSAVGRSGPNCEFAPCPPPKDEGVVCTQDAKLCPDGSYVARHGPDCEFASCPTPAGGTSGVMGKVMLGPTCPVERIPPDPACADKPFATSLVVSSKDGSKILKTFASSADGTFDVDLPPGEYLIGSAQGAAMLPRCASEMFTVLAGAHAQIQVSCDTGIR